MAPVVIQYLRSTEIIPLVLEVAKCQHTPMGFSKTNLERAVLLLLSRKIPIRTAIVPSTAAPKNVETTRMLCALALNAAQVIDCRLLVLECEI